MLTIRAPNTFLRKLQCKRPTCWNDAAGTPLTPLMPWITPSMPPKLLDAMIRLGSVRRLHPGEYVFKQNDRYDRLVLLLDGLGARAFGSLFTQTSAALALSVPGRLLGGNHCFFSGRPGVGRYFALTQANILSASSFELKQLMREDLSLAEESAAYLDMCLQSDRIGLGVIALLPARSRILAWALSWGFVYGELQVEPRGDEILRLSPVLPVDLIARVVSTNPSQVKRDLAELKKQGVLKRDGQDLLVLASALDPIWNWLYGIEELEAPLRRLPDWRVYVTAKKIDFSARIQELIRAKSGH